MFSSQLSKSPPCAGVQEVSQRRGNSDGYPRFNELEEGTHNRRKGMTVSSSPHLWQRSRESCSSRLGSGGCLPGSLQSLRRLTCDFSLACRGLPPSSGLQTVRRQNTVAYLKSRGAGAGVNVLEGIFV